MGTAGEFEIEETTFKNYDPLMHLMLEDMKIISILDLNKKI